MALTWGSDHAEGGFLGYGLGAGVDQVAAEAQILGPARPHIILVG